MNKERYPIVTTKAVKVGSQKVISVNVVSTALVNEDDNVDLIFGIDELTQSGVNKSDISSSFVKSSIS